MNDMESETFDRESLIALCSLASVPEKKWRNRDSQGAQRQLGECMMLLKAGCAFRVCRAPGDEPCKSDERTIWVEVTSKGFDYFEVSERSVDTFYIPTPKRLEERAGDDWY